MTHGNHFNSTLHYLHVTVMSINFDLYDFYVLPTLLGDIDFWSVHFCKINSKKVNFFEKQGNVSLRH
jgi:hypothetical protein